MTSSKWQLFLSASKCPSNVWTWRSNLPAIRLFVQYLVPINIKENIKGGYYLPFLRNAVFVTSIVSDCRDELPDCPSLAYSGECKRDPVFLFDVCKKSCGVCVDDVLAPGKLTLVVLNCASKTEFPFLWFLDIGMTQIVQNTDFSNAGLGRIKIPLVNISNWEICELGKDLIDTSNDIHIWQA